MNAIERAFINVVFLCGVDINLAHKYSHKSSTLQFVSGLGPRKAQALLVNLQSSSLVQREDLIRRHLISGVVFKNCASFIRIRLCHFTRKSHAEDTDPLDDTRIHPEDYAFARQMTNEVFEVLEEDIPVEESIQNIKDLFMKTGTQRSNLTRALDALDLNAYSDQLLEVHKLMKKLSLKDVRDELVKYVLIIFYRLNSTQLDSIDLT